MTSEEVLKIFKDSEALLSGHFLLTSGNHSPNYFQCAKVLQYPEFMERLCGEIARHFAKSNVQVVAAPAVGGIVVATEVGRQLKARTIFSEREDQKMSFRRGFQIHPGEKVLVVEDVVTTGGSVFEVMELVNRSGGELAGVGYLVDRSNGKVKFDVAHFSLLQMEVVTYSPEMCPLCKSGSTPVKPGSRPTK
jgi:orotate phosphoribosyltransferase